MNSSNNLVRNLVCLWLFASYFLSSLGLPCPRAGIFLNWEVGPEVAPCPGVILFLPWCSMFSPFPLLPPSPSQWELRRELPFWSAVGKQWWGSYQVRTAEGGKKFYFKILTLHLCSVSCSAVVRENKETCFGRVAFRGCCPCECSVQSWFWGRLLATAQVLSLFFAPSVSSHISKAHLF